VFRGYRLGVTQAATSTNTAAPARIDIAQAWFRWGVAGCVLAVATFLFSRLTAWPPHEDETLALFVGRRSLGQLLDIVLEERGGAPLHYLLAAVAAHSGGGLTALRLISAIFALASLPLVAALVSRLAGRGVALLATVLVSASWVLLFHGIYGRMYSLFLFTSALSYLALLWAADHGRAWRFALWGVAAVACVASHPYGALVLGSQGLYVLLVRRRVRTAVVAFAAVGVAGTPFWLADLRLANRFDVGVAGTESGKLGAPLPVLRYLGEVAGDFTAGWTILLVPIVALAAFGGRELWKRNRDAAVLVACVVGTPTAALLLARLGSSASPETRHLIFVVPFFMLVLAVALVSLGRRFGRSVLACGLAALIVAQVGWAYEKTPQLFTGDPDTRVAARHAAARWLAATSRPDDVFFGYEPLYLEAWERNEKVARVVIPRADAKLAAARLAALDRPIGRGLWVFDAYDTNNCTCTRALTIDERFPRPAADYEVRVFGPYLVVRTREPSRTPAAYLERAAQVMVVGKSLFIGDADINFVTVRRAADRLRLLDY
jgi:Dolichyl-phosphate-mannose-protein mannosyltransferase